MNTELTGSLCLGSLCLLPFVMFGLGLAIGSRRLRLPWRVVRVDDAAETAYGVDV